MSADTKWTPGPWEFFPGRDSTGSDDNVTLGSVRGNTADGSRYHVARVWSDAGGAETVAANALLIAAAPDLYAALDALRAAVLAHPDGGGMGLDPCGNPECSQICRAFTKAVRALARARGEDPDHA